MFARILIAIALLFPVAAFAEDAGVGSAVVEVGSGSAAPAAPDTSAAPADPAPPKAEDIGIATKLYKNGEWFGLGVLVLYVALFAGWKLDKKHAFYWATGLGGVAVIVESVRNGDTPTLTMMLSTLLPTVGIMITGPGHTKEPKAS